MFQMRIAPLSELDTSLEPSEVKAKSVIGPLSASSSPKFFPVDVSSKRMRFVQA